MQHGVHIDVHEVEQVLLVGGGHRVHGLVGEGQGVEERLHRGLEQVDEGLLDRVAVAAAEHRVLEDVEDAGVVGRRRLEGDGEGHVLVVVGKPHERRARDAVSHDVGGALNLRDLFRALDDKAVQLGAGGEVEAGLGGCLGHGWGLLPCKRCMACKYRRSRARGEKAMKGARAGGHRWDGGESRNRMQRCGGWRRMRVV